MDQGDGEKKALLNTNGSQKRYRMVVRFTREFNGTSLMWLIKEPGTDTIIQTDACLRGYGGICNNQYFQARFPRELRKKNIAVLEMWAVMVALKIWAKEVQGKYFWIQVDNEAVATILNTGSSWEIELQNTLREITLLAAQHQCVIKARYIPGVENRLTDWLSRWDEPQARSQFREYA